MINMIDKAGRMRAQELVQSDLVIDIPSIGFNRPIDPAELEALLAEIKARRYALFASLIDDQITGVEAVRSTQPDGGFPPSPYRQRAKTQFGKLRLDALKVFIESAETLEDTEDYLLLDELAEVRGELGDGYISPLGQLAAGSDTAITTMLNLLKNLPGIVRYHAPEQTVTPQELEDIATESIGLPWNIAMISINQMMALQATSAGQLLHKGWTNFDFDLNPSHFKVSRNNSGQVRSVKFDALEQMRIPAGYQYMEEDLPLGHPTPLHSIPDRGPGTIGCPITLLPQKMHKLWGWFIDDVSRDNLWQV